jgi:heme iron utilization protein
MNRARLGFILSEAKDLQREVCAAGASSVLSGSGKISPMDDRSAEVLRRIAHSTSVAALGTVGEGGPLVSMVPVALDRGRILIHVSGLAAHTSQLRADPRVSVMMMEPQSAAANPLALPRISFDAEASELARGTAEHERAHALYVRRHPRAEMLFGFGDFALFELVVRGGRLVAGFGAALDVSAEEIDGALAGLLPQDAL